LNKKIAELKAAQAKMHEDKKRLKKELRNAERKRKRIKERARQLTDEDLVAVLMMRKEHRREPAGKEATSAASTTPTGAGPADAEDVASPIENVGGPTQLEEMAP
jgi:acetyl-CoA carboxylase carboxyltransferase component